MSKIKHSSPPGPAEGRFFSQFWPTRCIQDTTPPPAPWLPPCQETGPAESGPGVQPWPCWWKSGKAAQTSAGPQVLWTANSNACNLTGILHTWNMTSSCPYELGFGSEWTSNLITCCLTSLGQECPQLQDALFLNPNSFFIILLHISPDCKRKVTLITTVFTYLITTDWSFMCVLLYLNNNLRATVTTVIAFCSDSDSDYYTRILRMYAIQ